MQTQMKRVKNGNQKTANDFASALYTHSIMPKTRIQTISTNDENPFWFGAKKKGEATQIQPKNFGRFESEVNWRENASCQVTHNFKDKTTL